MINKLTSRVIGVLGVLVFVILIFLILIPLYNFDNENYKYKIDKNNKLDLVNLGSSHGGSFLYDEFNIKGKKLNTEGNTIYYDLQVYKLIQENLSDNAIVTIPISYYYFGVDENRSDRKDNSSFVNKYYHILPPESIYEYNKQNHLDVISNEIKNNIPKVVFGERKKRSLKTQNRNTVVNIISEIDKVQKSNYDFKQKGILRSNKHIKMCSEENIEKNKVYLNELVQEIKNNNHIPIILITPMHDSYSRHFSKEWQEKFLYNGIDSIVKENDITFFDYSNDTRFIKRNDLFYNSDHLNNRGKLFFSYIFYNDLNKLENLNLKKIDLSFFNKKETLKTKSEKNIGFEKLSVKENENSKDFIFQFNEKVKNFQNYPLSVKLLNKNNKILSKKNIFNIKKNLKNNSLTKEISKIELINVEIISINFFEKIDDKFVKTSETVKINLKDLN